MALEESIWGLQLRKGFSHVHDLQTSACTSMVLSLGVRGLLRKPPEKISHGYVGARLRSPT